MGNVSGMRSARAQGCSERQRPTANVLSGHGEHDGGWLFFTASICFRISHILKLIGEDVSHQETLAAGCQCVARFLGRGSV